MPIVSKALESIRPQVVGVRVREVHTDHNGVRWTYPYLADSEAAATATMDARDLLGRLRDRERDDLVEFVMKGGSPADFVLVDITIPGRLRHVLRTFSHGDINNQRRFNDFAAPWIATHMAVQIKNSLDTTLLRANKTLGRAERLRDSLTEAMGLDDADVDEKVD